MKHGNYENDSIYKMQKNQRKRIYHPGWGSQEALINVELEGRGHFCNQTHKEY